MSRRGICLIWLRGRHISPSMPYREARSVAESSEGSTASKSGRTGRSPGMTRLVRRSSATSGGNALFFLLFNHSVSACVNVLSSSIILVTRASDLMSAHDPRPEKRALGSRLALPKKDAALLFARPIDISVDSTDLNVT